MLRFVQFTFLVGSLSPAAGGVTLSLGSGSGAPGTTVSLPLSIANSGSVVSAAQWTFTYSTTDFSAVTVEAGSSDTAAGKDLMCDSPAAGQYNCVISGLNQTGIPDGTIATVALTISATSTSSSSGVAVTGAAISDPNGSPVPATASGATVAIIQPGTTLAGLTCSPSSVQVAQSTSCTVTLAGAAGSGGAVVALGYSGSGSTVSGPASVTVPAGGSQAAFSVQATSATGNSTMTITASLNGTTQAFSLGIAPDSTPPSAPSNLTATRVSSSQIDLSWAPSADNAGVSGYLIERCEGSGCSNFAQVAMTTAGTYADTGLAARTTYSYRVRATDAAGNLSAYSNIATARTMSH